MLTISLPYPYDITYAIKQFSDKCSRSTLHTGPVWNRFVQKLFWCFYSHKSPILWAYIYFWYQMYVKNFRSFSTFYSTCKKSRSCFLVNAILFQIRITFTIFELHRCVTTHWKANSLYFSLMVHFLKKINIWLRYWAKSVFSICSFILKVLFPKQKMSYKIFNRF